MITPLKRYALTQLGQKQERRTFFRRDANCPVITHVRQKGGEDRQQVPGWLVNISEDGCLITSDHFPSRAEDLYIIVPGFEAKLLGRVVGQGAYTLNVRFSTPITAEMVSRAARLTVVPKD